MAWFNELKQPEAQRCIGQWIWPQGGMSRRVETGLFAGSFAIPDSATLMVLYVSAASRYTLWLGDAADALGRGPARNDLQHRGVDVYEIDLREKKSDNVALWAQVRWWAGSPEAGLWEIPASEPGFFAVALFLNDAGEILHKIGTGGGNEWRAILCEGLLGKKRAGIPGFICIGDADDQHSRGWPDDWRTAAAGESWPAPVRAGEPCFKGDPAMVTGAWSAHGTLIEREIAPLEESPVAVRDFWRMHDNTPEPTDRCTSIRASPGQRITWRADMGEEVLAYIGVTIAGMGTQVRVTTGEVFIGPPLISDERQVGAKSFNVADSVDKKLHPLTDTFIHDGTTPQFRFETSHWRAFRFLEIELTAGPDGGEILALQLTRTGYPLERAFEFAAGADDPQLAETIQKIADISWRTLRCCAWETYMDCPYYEQLQYIGDTRIQCLLTYVTTGDPLLPAQAIRAFDRSRIAAAGGLTLSRYPCAAGMEQIIPPFSLFYILMIEDYLTHTGDESLVAEVRPGIAPILNWFTRYMNGTTGLIGATPHWSFFDWVKGWDQGVPPRGINNTASGAGDASACVNLLYLLALQSATRLYERTKAGSGNFYAGRATALKTRIYDAFFDAARGLLCDVPIEVGRGKIGVWSQHAQALAVLAGVLSPTEATTAMAAALDPRQVLRPDESVGDRLAAEQGRTIAPASLYFRFYVAEALAALRMGDQLWPLLESFRAAVGRGSTTWPESFEPSRSECHAWSAWPLYFFARHLLGIAPPAADAGGVSAGDARTRVRPLHCPPLQWAKGRFMGLRGSVDVAVQQTPDGPSVTASGAGVEVTGS